MAQSARDRRKRITIALHLADAPFRAALAAAIAAAGDLDLGGTPADIAVADAKSVEAETATAVLLIGEPAPGPLASSVRAVLPTEAGPQTVVEAIRLVASGLLILPEDVFDRLREMPDDENGALLERLELTPREREVLQLLAAGASNKLIARRLDVSVHTAKFHVASLLRKLGASGRLEAVGIGLRTGLLMV